MANRVVEQFDQKIVVLEARLEAMRAIRNAIAQDPEFITVVQEILLNPASNGQPKPERAATAQQPDALNYERVVSYLLSAGNEWMSIRDICTGSKLKRNSIAIVLYTGGHKHLFEHKYISEARRVWRVRADAASLEGFPESCRHFSVVASSEPTENVVEELVPTIPIRSEPPQQQSVSAKSKYARTSSKSKGEIAS